MRTLRCLALVSDKMGATFNVINQFIIKNYDRSGNLTQDHGYAVALNN